MRTIKLTEAQFSALKRLISHQIAAYAEAECGIVIARTVVGEPCGAFTAPDLDVLQPLLSDLLNFDISTE